MSREKSSPSGCSGIFSLAASPCPSPRIPVRTMRVMTCRAWSTARSHKTNSYRRNSISSFSRRCVDESWKPSKPRRIVCDANHSSIGASRATAFFGYPRGHRVGKGLGALRRLAQQFPGYSPSNRLVPSNITDNQDRNGSIRPVPSGRLCSLAG
jgi:hypothetical protein